MKREDTYNSLKQSLIVLAGKNKIINIIKNARGPMMEPTKTLQM
jgi:hypothetical protein